MEKEVELSAGTVRYRDVGEGPVVLFVHGLLVDGALWGEVVDRLCATHRCIVPDWPVGSHRIPMKEEANLEPPAMAALVSELMQELDLSDVTLVGNDSGGAVCQLVAADHPDRLARLVLTNCDAFEVFPPKFFAWLKWLPRIPGSTFLLSRTMYHLPPLRRLPVAYGRLAKRRLSAELTRAWVEPSARDGRIRRDVAKFMAGVKPRLLIDAAQRLAAFDRPTLLLWGRTDSLFPISLAERLSAVLPRAKLVPIDDAATFVPLDRPDAVATEIASFAKA